MLGRMDGWRNKTGRSTRGAEKPCWCLPASDQVEWVVPSCSPSSYVVRLHVYSCKIMPTTPDVPDFFFDRTLELRLCEKRIVDYRFYLQFNTWFFHFIFLWINFLIYIILIICSYPWHLQQRYKYKNIRITYPSVVRILYCIVLCFIFARTRKIKQIKPIERLSKLTIGR